MVRCTIDEATVAKLGSLDKRLEICDETGRLLGYFTPATDPDLYDGVDSPLSKEELIRRSHEGGGRPLADILADLKKQE